MKNSEISKISDIILTVENNEEMKNFLLNAGFKVDRKGFVLSAKGDYVLDSNEDLINYEDIESIMPGSKVVIRKGDVTAISDYYKKHILKV